jgi:hypothetical protein
MSNDDFFKLLLQYWKPSVVIFKIEENGKIGLYRDNDNSPISAGESFEDIITQLRLYFSETLIKAEIKKTEAEKK